MTRVILLNGPAGVGKTTVGRRLAQSARNGDDLKRFVVAREVELGTIVDRSGAVDAVVGAALARCCSG